MAARGVAAALPFDLLCCVPAPAAGEDGLTSALFKYGYNVDTLMAMYRGVSSSAHLCLSAVCWLG